MHMPRDLHAAVLGPEQWWAGLGAAALAWSPVACSDAPLCTSLACLDKMPSVRVVQGRGTCLFRDGDQYTGEWKDGLQEGIGLYSYADGAAEIGTYVAHKDSGDGVRWDETRQEAWLLKDGVKGEGMSLQDAKLAAARLGHAVPLRLQ